MSEEEETMDPEDDRDGFDGNEAEAEAMAAEHDDDPDPYAGTDGDGGFLDE